MCVTCMSQTEAVVLQASLFAAMVREPVHRMLSDVGVLAAPLTVSRDASTVAFLRSMDLDAAAVLGADVVGEADKWVAAGRPRPARWGSLALLSAGLPSLRRRVRGPVANFA